MNSSARPSSALQVLEQVDDLRLDRDVERRHRLVADDEVWLGGERAGDADALALAAGEFVRPAMRGVARQAHGVEQHVRCAGRDRLATSRGRNCGSARQGCRAPCRRGLRLENGSWKTTCMRRRSGRSVAAERSSMRRPSSTTCPAVMSNRRSTARPTVHLPQPDSPTRASVSPRSMWNDTPSTARTAPAFAAQAPPQRKVLLEIVDLKKRAHAAAASAAA